MHLQRPKGQQLCS